DMDLAALYEVETRVLNQSVKRNSKRFPDDFMFQLTKIEYENIKYLIDSKKNAMSSQIVMTYSTKRPSAALPYAFTEQGVAMLSGILNSDRAINMNIAIMRAFVAARKFAFQQMDTKEQLKEITERLTEHDAQLNQIYDAMENLLDERIAQKKWEEREIIGFKK